MNIQSVKKLKSKITNQVHVLIMTLDNGKVVYVPNESEENTDYQEILEWVANGGTIVDNGS